ncbi:MAG: hypothetical protein HQ506_11210 [Candidatus Marinimicrobia bacterium]|nr:hypothetical protein [Candidatus Neomarinimicrobiota bacterium]
MLPIIKLFKLVVVVTLLVSCGIMDPGKENIMSDEGAIRIEYLGLEWAEGGYAPRFSLVNDSTETVQYVGYGETYPLYSAEAFSDTGWTNLMWGWCGTGAEFYALEPNSSVEFLAAQPNSSCTWRLVLDITDIDSVGSRRLRSENIGYTVPQN